MSETKSGTQRRRYYSARSGKISDREGFTLEEFTPFFKSFFDRFDEAGYFQEWFGYHCVDAGEVPGQVQDIALYIQRKLRKRELWPIHGYLNRYSEDDLFDMIEFLFDHASKGDQGTYHSYSNCGMHYSTFNKVEGQKDFRDGVNELLAEYGNGFELSAAGEILALPEAGLVPLIEAPLPHPDKANVGDRVEAARLKYLRRSSTAADRRDAVRDLADVLEYLRPEAKKVLNSKDEAGLFSLANNFGIRHHKQGQKNDYDPAIWLSWMFYYYLVTIHACVRLIEKASGKNHA